ncbi:MAG: hypothetical protein ACRD1X_17875 [Vicinamibacteria bacterium]
MWMWLIATVLAGLAVVSIISILRALLPARYTSTKPLSCDLCMGWWGSLTIWLLAAVLENQRALVLMAFGTHAVTLLVLSRLRPPAFPEFIARETEASEAQESGSWPAGGGSKGEAR